MSNGEGQHAMALYRGALGKERSDTTLAALVFGDAARATIQIDWRILFAGTAGMALAYLIAFATPDPDGGLGPLVPIVILSTGATPAMLLFSRKQAALQRQLTGSIDPIGRLGAVWLGVGALFFVVFSTQIQLALTVVIGSLLAALLLLLPVDLIESIVTGSEFSYGAGLPSGLQVSLLGVGILITFLVVASDVRLAPLSLTRVVREIPIGLKANREQTVSFLASTLLVLLFASAAARYGVVYENLRLGLPLFAIDGALLGLTFGRVSIDPQLSALAQISRARCKLRLGRRIEAYYELSVALDRLELATPYRDLGRAMLILLDEGLGNSETRKIATDLIDVAVAEIPALVAHAGPFGELLYGDLFRENARRIAELAVTGGSRPGGSEARPSRGLVIAVAVLAWSSLAAVVAFSILGQWLLAGAALLLFGLLIGPVWMRLG